MELVEGGVKVVCRVTHTAGHSEESPMQVPFGNKTDIMSNTQVTAAAQTFAKRYAFCNAFGILTGDEDNDAPVSPQKSPVAAYTPRPAPKPAQPAIATPKPKKTDRELIALYLEELGIDYTDKEQAKAVVLSITQLTLEEPNYAEIASRLSVTVHERREAKVEAEKLKQLNAAPVT
jgi:hypothetical protein